MIAHANVMVVMSSKLLYMPVDIEKKDKEKRDRKMDRKQTCQSFVIYTVYRKRWINNQTKDKRMTIACDNW